MVKVFHKPYGVLSQFKPLGDKPTLMDYEPLRQCGKAVGRLDQDSEGLLLITSWVWLQNALTRPGAVAKGYWVQVEGWPEEAALERLRQGVLLKDGVTRPALVERIEEPPVKSRVPPIRERKSIPTCWLQVTLCQGRNRQVRRMTAAVGHPTLRLIRFRVGPIRLEGLPAGCCRPPSAEEAAWIKSLRSAEEAKPGRRTAR